MRTYPVRILRRAGNRDGADSGGMEEAMSRIARSLSALTVVVGVVFTATPVAAAPRATHEAVAEAVIAWYGRLLQLLGGDSSDGGGAVQTTSTEQSPPTPGTLCEGGSETSAGSTCDQSEADNGPGIDPDG